MDNRRLLDDVYKDFFGDKVLTNIDQKEEPKVDINQIDNMLLEDNLLPYHSSNTYNQRR